MVEEPARISSFLSKEDILSFERNPVWRYFLEVLLPEKKDLLIFGVANTMQGEEDRIQAIATAKYLIEMQNLPLDVVRELEEDLRDLEAEQKGAKSYE